jgi:hypothetical protein
MAVDDVEYIKKIAPVTEPGVLDWKAFTDAMFSR